jgi:F-box-like
MAMDDEEAIWDITLCVDHMGLPVTPFRYFANPQIPVARQNPKSFPHLLDLPPEMLLLVFQFCDASTLFQFMRTCRRFRYMTSKLFWSDSTVLYQLYRGWWDSRKLNLPVRLDMEFARQVTQIEIFIPIEREFGIRDREGDDGYRLGRTERASFFWLAVQNSFPSARRIVLSSFGLFYALEDEECGLITFLLKQAPRHIRVFVATTPGPDSKAERALWSIDTSATPQLQPISTSWLPKRVTAPPRQFSEGPLREFELMCGIKRLLRLEEMGLVRLTREARRRYSDGKRRCKCKRIRYAEILYVCGFMETGWKLTGFSRQQASEEVDPCENIPSHVKDFLGAKEARITALRDDYGQAWLKLRKVGDNGTQCRERFMDMFEKQVEEELYPSTNPRSESEREDYMLRYFWPFFDPYFGMTRESSPSIGNDWEFEHESSDGSDWGSPFVDVALEQRKRERRDEFWRRAGFVAKGRDS